MSRDHSVIVHRVYWTMARLAFLLAVLSLAAVTAQAQSPLDASKPQLTLCQGNFALCAAATCTLTGRMFPGTSFQEVVCKCPVIDGQALADLTGGNMQGTCAPPIDPATGKAGVWSLFWPMLNIPQEVDGRWRKNVPSLPHNCPAQTGDPAQTSSSASASATPARTSAK